jgi:hypothetical protein
MKNKIKHYLAAGLKPVDIVSLVGCSPAYISQLLQDESFKQDVQELATNAPALPETRLENKYEVLEHKIVECMAAEAVGSDLNTLSRALDSVTRARDARHKKTLPFGGANPTIIQNVTSISVPYHALAMPKMVLNENAEVIAIDDKPMAPLSSEGVKKLFSDIASRREESEFKESSNGPATLPLTAQEQHYPSAA